MKREFTVNVKSQRVVTHLVADCGVRYWEDSEINGVGDDENNPAMPFKQGDRWVIKIDLANGAIQDWPKGTTANIHYKICDDGVYTLLDCDGKPVAKIDGYVPEMLCPDDDGYGDYVIMMIDENGRIDKWKPSFAEFARQED